MREVVVVDYLSSWPLEYESEKRLIEPLIHHLRAEIHHIGSTSVQGLAAKPIIDILIEVDGLADIDKLNSAFLEIGYSARGENGIPERRYFEKGGEDRTHQIHVFLRNSENAIRHLAFRDYLRAHSEVAEQYADLKKHIAKQCDHSIEKYCDGKHEFVQYHEKIAVSCYSPLA